MAKEEKLCVAWFTFLGVNLDEVVEVREGFLFIGYASLFARGSVTRSTLVKDEAFYALKSQSVHKSVVDSGVFAEAVYYQDSSLFDGV